ncbi:MAG: hypothetical protein Q9M50_06685 [Methylococcales bacterium]|nr:hypothetical protein [Methylococcales bacterium]
MFNLSPRKKVTPSETIPKKAKEESGVDKYLTKQTTVEESQPVEKPSQQNLVVSVVDEIKPSVAEIADEPVSDVDVKTETDEIIKPENKATQCQAATMKGSRCRRKSGLKTIEKMVNGQQQQYSVCSQHNNDLFVLFVD